MFMLYLRDAHATEIPSSPAKAVQPLPPLSARSVGYYPLVALIPVSVDGLMYHKPLYVLWIPLHTAIDITTIELYSLKHYASEPLSERQNIIFMSRIVNISLFSTTFLQIPIHFPCALPPLPIEGLP